MPLVHWDSLFTRWDGLEAWDAISSSESVGTALGKNPVQFLEITLPRCTRRCGVSPCTGTTNGPTKCYNTLWTCQDKANFVSADFIIHTASQRIDELQAVNGLPCFPTLLNTSNSPTEITPTKGLGVRASMSASIQDHPYNDINLDHYATERGYNPEDRGSLWGKIVARWKYFENLKVRQFSGYIDASGIYDVANFRTKTYFLQKVDGPDAGGMVKITCKDPLRWGDKDKAQCPLPSKCKTLVDMTTSTTSFTVSDISDIPAGVEWLRIDKEIMKVISRDDGTGTFVVTRATMPTWYDPTAMVAETHSTGAGVQWCMLFDGARIDAVIATLLQDYTEVPAAYIDTAQMAAEADVWFSTYYMHALITEPIEVTKLLDEICLHLAIIWWDERTSKIKLTAVKPAQGTLQRLSDGDNLQADTVQLSYDYDSRISQAWCYYAMRTPIVENENKLFNYSRTQIAADLDTELPDQYGQPAIREILSRWLTKDQQSLAIEITSRLLAEFKNTKSVLTFKVDAKDDSLWTTDFCRVSTRYRQTVTGDASSVPCLVMKSAESYNATAEVTYTVREMAATSRCAVIGPDTLFDYMAESEENHDLYAWFSSGSPPLMSNGDPTYTIC